MGLVVTFSGSCCVIKHSASPHASSATQPHTLCHKSCKILLDHFNDIECLAPADCWTFQVPAIWLVAVVPVVQSASWLAYSILTYCTFPVEERSEASSSSSSRWRHSFPNDKALADLIRTGPARVVSFFVSEQFKRRQMQFKLRAVQTQIFVIYSHACNQWLSQDVAINNSQRTLLVDPRLGVGGGFL